MAFPGTITLPEEHFKKVVEWAARSFRKAGFKDIILIGDSGPNQKGLEAVAKALNLEWVTKGVRVHYIPDYYYVGYDEKGGFVRWLESAGEKPVDIGRHAGIADTSQLMAVDPALVRNDKLAPGGNWDITGVSGNPTRATEAYGKRGLDMRVDAAVAQIRTSMRMGR